MSVRRYEDLFAWQLGESFKSEVFRLMKASQEACRDLRYRGQLLDSASAVPKDLAEGFTRHSPAELMRFIDYTLGSLAEAKDRLADGVELGYFAADACEEAFRFAKRCKVASLRLKASQRDYLDRQQDEKRRQRRNDNTDKPPGTCRPRRT